MEFEENAKLPGIIASFEKSARAED